MSSTKPLDKTIRVSDELKAELRKRGIKGESYGDIIWRLLKPRRHPAQIKLVGAASLSALEKGRKCGETESAARIPVQGGAFSQSSCSDVTVKEKKK
jgi:predicted CopG family antitoxin